ncbi:Ig-like domain-containing protein [Aestuariivivens sp. NBU2969]|uniref:Ig-like domain-containing protein n=1 Tax=Aestuariivivens sp. NBU2969 TaxID=2873267 RepID=UPI001CBDB39D|nr:Ig-like domain-containing protein [Aestuariivivens sp. NBU2969]
MNKTFANLVLLIFLSLGFINCANKGTPGGGPKDETPPVIIKSEPENFSTNFKAREITIHFDEYIKLKDIQKQLIISPPLKSQPEIKPLGGASRYISIKIFDTLQPNTTYAFNFGNSIQDNNEGNPFSYFRYVFSTGDYIDSLTVNGAIVDAIERKNETFVNIGLYEVDSTFNDSIIYKEKPKYITNTLDSLTSFTIENIKEGKYLLIAFKDNNGDYKFQQKTDKIGFHKGFINIPTDSTYTLKLFKEDLDFKSTRPKLISGEKIAFGYEGDYKNMDIKLLFDTPQDFEYRITKDQQTDSLYYWYKPRLEVDSLIFKVSNQDFEKDYTVRISAQKRDSLTITSSPSGNITYKEPLKISGSIPFAKLDETKINIEDKDSTKVVFTTAFDTIQNTYHINFEKKADNRYRVQVLPEAILDFFDNTNDTLNYVVSTKKISDYGNLRVIINNATYPLIVQLMDSNGKVKYEKYTTTNEALDFINIDSGKYYLRAIFDANKNGKYDTGSYLKKIQPERVSLFIPEESDGDIRAGWDEIWNINLSN